MKTAPLMILGAGQVGRTLVSQLLESADLHRRRDGVQFVIRAWADKDRELVEPAGLSTETLRSAVESWSRQAPLAGIRGSARSRGAESLVAEVGSAGCILVDVTASPDTGSALVRAISSGMGGAIANKVPLVGDQKVFDLLVGSGAFRYESTVGSAVPVIEAIWALNRCADEVNMVQGVLSGTLGFLCTSLEEGKAFSATVREAMDRGYTEPDPRIDLGGMDVARKALIIARSLGWKVSLDEVSVESLVPPELAALPLPEFLRRMESLDIELAARVSQAKADGLALRYVAQLKGGDIKVGLAGVPKETAIGRLRGNDNLVAFHSRFYPAEPLILQGRGAGVDAAAAGVHADIVALAAAMGSA